MGSKLNLIKTRKQTTHTGKCPDNVGHSKVSGNTRKLRRSERIKQDAILKGEAIIHPLHGFMYL